MVSCGAVVVAIVGTGCEETQGLPERGITSSSIQLNDESAGCRAVQ